MAAVARLVAINDLPLSLTGELKEQTRLSSLLSDSSRQRHRKQAEDERHKPHPESDASPALRVHLPIRRHCGWSERKNREIFLQAESQVRSARSGNGSFTAMTGEIWIDAAQGRVESSKAISNRTSTSGGASSAG